MLLVLGTAPAAIAQTEIPESHAPSPVMPTAVERPFSTARILPMATPDAAATAAAVGLTTPSAGPPEGPTAATSLQITSAGGLTQIALGLTRAVPVHVFTLADPYRIVIDAPEVSFDFLSTFKPQGAGLIAAYRYGLLEAGRSRIVLDTTGPVRLVRTAVIDDAGGHAARLEIAVAPSTAAMFAAALEPLPRNWATMTEVTSSHGAVPTPVRTKFVVVIDPGHGGIDGGAVSTQQVLEKNIVLAVGLDLKAALDATGHYDTRMTRSTDKYISLDQRVAFSRAVGADLFVSLHADSVGDAALASTVHGATIYTLSDHASSRAAQAQADKENAVDTVHGVAGSDAAGAAQVKTILADLTQRETMNFSTEFRRVLMRRLAPAHVLGRDPARSAGFKVLRQAQTPAVLIELGFLTHPDDATRLQQTAWQKSVAGAVAAAIETYAARRTLGTR